MSADPQAHIRHRLFHLRRRYGLTQANMAASLGISRMAYNRCEAGTRRISADEIEALACVLCTTVAHLREPAERDRDEPNSTAPSAPNI